jgi:uncharacterized protein (TIGR02246 family)
MASPGSKNADVMAAIRALDARFVENVQARNVDKLVDDFYWPDAQVLAPERPPIRGRASLVLFWRGLFETANVKEFAVDTTEVDSEGDLAVATGSYRMTAQVPDGGTETRNGKYTVAFRRREGQWRATVDMFSSNG